MLAKFVCSVFAVSLVAAVAAQTPAQKKPPVKKAPAPTKAPPKTPPPAPEPPPPPPPPPTDVSVHTKLINGAQISENSTFFKGVRQRYEFPGIAMINQCDLKRSVQVNPATKRYMVTSTDAAPPSSAPPPPAPDPPDVAQITAMSKGGRGGAPPKPKGGVVTETITLTDTGERKQLFGREARHIKMVVARQPGPNACETKTTRIETDGWYVDLPDHDVCPASPPPPPSATPADGACTDKVETRRAGEAKLGFAVVTRTTTTTEDGKDSEVTSSTMEVTDLRVTTLDAAMFDVPPDYTEVKNYQELLPSLAHGGNLSDALFGSIADGTSAIAPKQPGVIRIGVADPGNKTNRNVPISALRVALVAAFSKAPFEALPIAGASQAELTGDATAKACDYVIVSDLAELKSARPGKVGGMLKKVSGDPGAQEEVHDARVDYKLFAIADQAKPRMSASAKASSSAGFGLSSALRVATFAGSMYMGVMTMGMMGGNPMMNMMSSYSSFGAGMGGGMSGLVNPGMGAAVSIMSQASMMKMPGTDDDLKYKALETAEDAMSKVGKQVAEEFKKKAPAGK